MKIALVTGASSGLGREFAMRLANEDGVEAIWAVARHEDRLRALAEECSVPVRTLPLDLTKTERIDELERLLAEEKPEVAVLVCAAGYGKIGDDCQISRRELGDMIDLNCRACVEVTAVCLPYMQRGGRILEISSTSAFQPFPYLNVYAATKAFVYRYARALRVELRGRGISVTAVCPYWVKDTGFIPTAQDTDGGGAIRHFPLASRTERVVAWALRDSRLGLAVSTPGPVCMIHRVVAKVVPSGAMMALWELIRRA